MKLSKSFVAMRMGNVAPSECWMHKSWINSKYLLMTLPRYTVTPMHRYRCIRISALVSVSQYLSLFSLCNLANIVEYMRIQFHSQFRWLARRSPRLSNFERYRPAPHHSPHPLAPSFGTRSFGKLYKSFEGPTENKRRRAACSAQNGKVNKHKGERKWK